MFDTNVYKIDDDMRSKSMKRHDSGSSIKSKGEGAKTLDEFSFQFINQVFICHPQKISIAGSSDSASDIGSYI